MTTMLRQERLRRKWTLEYVAEQIGVTKSAIQMLETGATKPSYSVLVKLLYLFDYAERSDALITVRRRPGAFTRDRAAPFMAGVVAGLEAL